MNKIKAIILISIIALVVIITILLFITRPNELVNKDEEEILREGGVQITSTRAMEKTRVRDLYYSTQASIEDYLSYIVEKNADAILQILDTEYVKENNITEQNLFEKIPEIKTIDLFRVEDMYTITREGTFSNYVYGIVEIEGKKAKWYGILDTNYENFVITPCSEEDYNNIITNKIDTGEKNINTNEFNKFHQVQISDEQMVRNYFEDYKRKVLEDPESAYALLDEEYKKSRFSTYDSFAKYVNENRTNLENAVLKSYKATPIQYDYYTENEYTRYEYELLDTNGNYYIINENAILDYTIKLDNYTTKSEEYMNIYNGLSDNEKITNNINEYFQMINAKAFDQAYSKLYESFKSRYFPTEEDFEKYAKNNYYENAIIGIESIKQNNGVYTCEIVMKESLSSAAEKKDLTLMMQLGENADYRISFSME